MIKPSRHIRVALASVLIASTTWSAYAANVTPPPAGYQPDLKSDEGGLWMVYDQNEKSIQQSPLLVKDEALNGYVKKLVCDLAGPQCPNIRVYILDIPGMNAAMAPNGAMIVWTGLMLRAKNEAQLAFVLGHEITHYTKRHSLEMFQSAHDTSNALALFSVLTLGYGTLLAALVASGALVSYSRDQEREADAGGFDLGVALGYDPRQAADIWTQQIEEEAAATDSHKRSVFFSAHPTSKDRLAAMVKRADEIEAQTHANNVGAEAFRTATLSHRKEWLDEELNRGELSQSIVVVDRLIQDDPTSGELRFYLGEAFRRRNAKDDLDNAKKAYADALASGNAPSATYRGLGLVSMKGGDKAAARDALKQYLSAVPAADDRSMIELYLSQL